MNLFSLLGKATQISEFYSSIENNLGQNLRFLPESQIIMAFIGPFPYAS